MKVMPLLGILFILYAVMCIFIAVKKPPKMWDMKKIQGFRKALGDKGTVIFFCIWGLGFGALGVWLLTK